MGCGLKSGYSKYWPIRTVRGTVPNYGQLPYQPQYGNGGSYEDSTQTSVEIDFHCASPYSCFLKSPGTFPHTFTSYYLGSYSVVIPHSVMLEKEAGRSIVRQLSLNFKHAISALVAASFSRIAEYLPARLDAQSCGCMVQHQVHSPTHLKNTPILINRKHHQNPPHNPQIPTPTPTKPPQREPQTRSHLPSPSPLNTPLFLHPLLPHPTTPT